jgi:hypothetical protein
MPTFDENARFFWQKGKPNPFAKGTGPWERTELARKMSGKTCAAFIKANGGRTSTLATLVGKRLIEIEGYTGRAREEEMQARYAALFAIVAEQRPMTVRQVFYQATVRGIVEKEESGYDKVQHDLVQMRRGNSDDFLSLIPTPFNLPWEWIVDNTRSRDKPYVCNSPREALEDAANSYRKALWTDADAYVEIWLEKDALAGVLSDITRKYDVSLMVARGYSSVTFLHDAAEDFPTDRPVYIYHLGDFDPSGVNAGEKIEEDLREFAPTADISFTRLAVTPEQIKQWRLPSRPTKRSDSRAARFGSRISVELDAIEAASTSKACGACHIKAPAQEEIRGADGAGAGRAGGNQEACR